MSRLVYFYAEAVNVAFGNASVIGILTITAGNPDKMMLRRLRVGGAPSRRNSYDGDPTKEVADSIRMLEVQEPTSTMTLAAPSSGKVAAPVRCTR